MTSQVQIGPIKGCRFSCRTRLVPLVVAAVCAAQVSRPLWSQSFTSCGTNICSSAGASVGIGTTMPANVLDVEGGNTSPVVAQFGSGAAHGTQVYLTNTSGGGTWGLISAGSTLSVPAGDFALYGGGGYRLVITPGGNVGIGTTSPQHVLQVAGDIGAKEVVVSSTGADYVFKPGYHLSPLKEVATYIEQNHHLPGIPSEKEVQAGGVNLGEMQTKLLAKIEELTLLMIQEDERNTRNEQQNRELQARIAELEGRVANSDWVRTNALPRNATAQN